MFSWNTKDWPPCLLGIPFGAPGFVPPCILQREFKIYAVHMDKDSAVAHAIDRRAIVQM